MGAHAASCPVALLQIIQQGDALFEVFQFIGHHAGVSSQQDVHTRGMLFARCLWAVRFADRLGKIKTCAAAKLLLARSAATGPNHQIAATEDFKSRAELLLAREATRCRRSRWR